MGGGDRNQLFACMEGEGGGKIKGGRGGGGGGGEVVPRPPPPPKKKKKRKTKGNYIKKTGKKALKIHLFRLKLIRRGINLKEGGGGEWEWQYGSDPPKCQIYIPEYGGEF